MINQKIYKATPFGGFEKVNFGNGQANVFM